MKNPLEGRKSIIVLILIFLSINSIFLYLYREIWWDSAVYIGMGKYIWSFGNFGLWEPARPLVLPLFSGFMWKIGLNTWLFTSIAALLASAASIMLIYTITKKLSSHNAAFFFSFLFSMNSVFFYFSDKVMTEVFAMFFTLLAFYFSIEKRYAKSGFFCALSSLTKFTHLIFLPIFLFYILFEKKKKLKQASFYILGASAIIVPFLIFNQIAYSSPLATFTEGHNLISSVVGNYTCPKSHFFYFNFMAMQTPLLIIIVVFGMLFLQFTRKILKNKILLMTAILMIFPFIYHSFFVNCKDLRYSLSFLPYFYILAALLFYIILKKSGNNKIFLCLILALLAAQTIYSVKIAYDTFESKRKISPQYGEFYTYLKGKEIHGEIWSTTPIISLYSDAKITELIYYPVTDNKRMDELILGINRKNIEYIFFNGCDIPCVNYDSSCPQKILEFQSKLESDFNESLSMNITNCSVKVYGARK